MTYIMLSADYGLQVILAGRDANRIGNASAAITALLQSPQSRAVPMLLDLSDLSSVRSFADAFKLRFDRLDGLINNAGIMMPPLQYTKDGFESQMGTNHFGWYRHYSRLPMTSQGDGGNRDHTVVAEQTTLNQSLPPTTCLPPKRCAGHFLLTNLLLDVLKSTAATTGDTRVINVASNAHHLPVPFASTFRDVIDDLNWKHRTYNRMAAYAQSKLANVLFSRELAKRMEGTGVTSYSVHPGVIRTELGRYVPGFDVLTTLLHPLLWVGMKGPFEGAQTQLYLALAPLSEVQPHNGLYFADGAVSVSPNPEAYDDDLARQLWEISERDAGLRATATVVTGK